MSASNTPAVPAAAPESSNSNSNSSNNNNSDAVRGGATPPAPAEGAGTTVPPPGMPTAADSHSALELKAIANRAFVEGSLAQALGLYTRALEVAAEESATPDRELLGVLYSNRSITNFQAGNYQAAVDDASAALVERPQWVKAFHRKALSVAALGDFRQATELYREAIRLEPENKWIKKMLKQMEKQRADAPIRNEADWAKKYEDLAPQPIRMATLVHYWNICNKKERYAALSRLSELANYRFALNEELMGELPLERYKVSELLYFKPTQLVTCRVPCYEPCWFSSDGPCAKLPRISSFHRTGSTFSLA